MNRAGASSRGRTEKLVLIGAASTGKTALVTRFAKNIFAANSEATIGAAFVSKDVTVQTAQGPQALKLEIWDTGGQERYRGLAPLYYRDSRACILVVDVSARRSFEEATQWVAELREKGQAGVIILLVGNKIDLPDREVSSEELREFQFAHQLDVVKETSALTGQGVVDVFDEAAKLLLALPEKASSPEVMVDEVGTKPPSGCC